MDLVQTYIALIETLRGNALALPVFTTLYALACLGAPISLFPVAGGILFGTGWGMLVNQAALLLGASAGFGAARRLGRERFSRFLRHRGHRGILAVLRDPGPGAFIVMRAVGFPPFAMTNYLAGLSHMTWRRFLWTSAVGLFPWTFVMTFFSGTFWQILVTAGAQGFRRALLEHSRPLIWGALVLACVLATGAVLRNRVMRSETSGGDAG